MLMMMMMMTTKIRHSGPTTNVYIF